MIAGEGVDGLDGVVSSPEELAEIIEDKIFEKNKQTNPKYKAQVRSRVFNLKDKKNPSLRENVLCGTIKPEKLAIMTSEEMASDEVRESKFVCGFWAVLQKTPHLLKYRFVISNTFAKFLIGKTITRTVHQRRS